MTRLCEMRDQFVFTKTSGKFVFDSENDHKKTGKLPHWNLFLKLLEVNRVLFGQSVINRLTINSEIKDK